MKIHLLLPAMLFGFIFLLPGCDDKVTFSTEYYTPEEYAVLSASLNLPSVPLSYANSQIITFPGTSPGPRPPGPPFLSPPTMDHIATLGRVLFYDKNLSSDNSVSCASCHQQELAFADDVPFSTGIMGRNTSRNSIALGVFRSFGSYSDNPETTLFWDGRVDNLHDQMIETIANPSEMGMAMNEVEAKIRDIEHYKILSRKAFGTDQLNRTLILDALEGFMKSISSTSSHFDHASKNVNFFQHTGNFPTFSAKENEGKALFQTNCVSCHHQGVEELSAVNVFQFDLKANNGLDLVYADKGEGEINNSPQSIGIFKIPSLRNIQLTGPYMHDGRFGTLQEVIDFYSDGIQNHPNLHTDLKSNGVAKKFNFTASEKEALVLFLNSLTDPMLINDEKWSDPFL